MTTERISTALGSMSLNRINNDYKLKLADGRPSEYLRGEWMSSDQTSSFPLINHFL